MASWQWQLQVTRMEIVWPFRGFWTEKGRYNGSMGHSQPAKHSTTSAKSEVAEREKQREKHADVSPLASAERAYAQLFELLVWLPCSRWSPSLHKSEQRIRGCFFLVFRSIK